MRTRHQCQHIDATTKLKLKSKNKKWKKYKYTSSMATVFDSCAFRFGMLARCENKIGNFIHAVNLLPSMNHFKYIRREKNK